MDQSGESEPTKPKGPMLAEMEYLLASEDFSKAHDKAYKLVEREAKRISSRAEPKYQEYIYKTILNSGMWEIWHHLLIISRRNRNIKSDEDDKFSEKG